MGSVAVIGSTAAVAIACEGKTFSKIVNKSGTPEAQALESKQEAEAEIEKKPNKPGGSDESTQDLRKQVSDAEEAVKEAEKEATKAKQNLRDANQKYQDALKKGTESGKTPLDPEIGKEIDRTESEVSNADKKAKEAEQKLKNAKDKLQKLRDSRPANAGDLAGTTIEA
ncbi:lipoprotein, (VlcB) [Mycoplasma mycoides]|uniref:lipoprotein, (VlcB) n=1 Tax=Mycoplasma mycoides TaxID=2102 RepID=UPI00223EEC05|nr:lipoprotein, (VlcB) [Mycoplasma mycoides]